MPHLAAVNRLHRGQRESTTRDRKALKNFALSVTFVVLQLGNGAAGLAGYRAGSMGVSGQPRSRAPSTAASSVKRWAGSLAA